MALTRRLFTCCILSWCTAALLLCLCRVLFHQWMILTLRCEANPIRSLMEGYYQTTTLSAAVLVGLCIWRCSSLRSAVRQSHSVVGESSRFKHLTNMLLLLTTLAAAPIVFWEGGQSLAFALGCTGSYQLGERIFRVFRTPEDADESMAVLKLYARKMDQTEDLSQIRTVTEVYGPASLELAALYLDLGDHSRWSGDNRTACDYFQQSLMLYKTHSRLAGWAEALCKLALCHVEMGDTADAEPALRRAASLINRLNDNELDGVCLRSLAELAQKTGDDNLALFLYRRANATEAAIETGQNRNWDYEFGHAVDLIATSLSSLTLVAGIRRRSIEDPSVPVIS